jgi:hypothetical protein
MTCHAPDEEEYKGGTLAKAFNGENSNGTYLGDTMVACGLLLFGRFVVSSLSRLCFFCGPYGAWFDGDQVWCGIATVTRQISVARVCLVSFTFAVPVCARGWTCALFCLVCVCVCVLLLCEMMPSLCPSSSLS